MSSPQKPPQNSQQNQPQNQAARQLIDFQAVHHSGPIPHPALLSKYNEVVPNAAERIIKMAEEQSGHRIKMEAHIIHVDAINSTLGIIAALVITLGVLCLSAYALMLGQPIAAGFMSTLGIGGIVGTFIYGTRRRQAEREKRSDK